MTLVVATVALLLGPITGLPAQATTRKSAPTYQPVSGTLLTGPCFKPSTQFYDPLTGKFDCEGIAQFSGGWRGSSRFRARGIIDPLSNDAHGSIDDLLDVQSQDGAGKLRLVGQFTVNRMAGVIVIRSRIVSGDGDFKHAQGRITTTGFMPVPGGPITANYEGKWAHD